MNFDPGIEVRTTESPLGFIYGDDVTGPRPENRSLDSIRKSLMDPNCQGPDPVYSIVMDVAKKKDLPILKDLNLLFGVVCYAKGRLGKEPVRSQGHIHIKSEFAGGWSTPEVYEIWSGRAIVFMQESAKDDPGRCFSVIAEPGDIVLVPPGWAHATISADPFENMTFGAWCVRDYGFEYDDVRNHKGLAWFPVLRKNSSIGWMKNTNYKKHNLIEKKPDSYSLFDLNQGIPIYKQFENDPLKFRFVCRPDLYADNWERFTP